MKLICASHIFKFVPCVKNRNGRKGRNSLLTRNREACNLPGRHVPPPGTTCFKRHTPQLLTPPLTLIQVTCVLTRRLVGRKSSNWVSIKGVLLSAQQTLPYVHFLQLYHVSVPQSSPRCLVLFVCSSFNCAISVTRTM